MPTTLTTCSAGWGAGGVGEVANVVTAGGTAGMPTGTPDGLPVGRTTGIGWVCGSGGGAAGVAATGLPHEEQKRASLDRLAPQEGQVSDGLIGFLLVFYNCEIGLFYYN